MTGRARATSTHVAPDTVSPVPRGLESVLTLGADNMMTRLSDDPAWLTRALSSYIIYTCPVPTIGTRQRNTVVSLIELVTFTNILVWDLVKLKTK